MSNEIFRAAIQRAWETGHFWSPDNPEGAMVKQQDLDLLKPGDPVAVQALISMAKADTYRYTQKVLDVHGRQPHFDGEAGPAMAAFIDDSDCVRCPVPDHAPPPGVQFQFEDPDLQKIAEAMQRNQNEPDALPAFGSGSYKGCHGVENFHCAAVEVDDSGMRSHVRSVFKDIIKNVQAGYAVFGLLIKYIDKSGKDILTGEPHKGTIQSKMSFVSSSDGWIGLAIVGNRGETCSSPPIWLKFRSDFGDTFPLAAVLIDYGSLMFHEHGHNWGLGHTNGGIMNGTLIRGLPIGFPPTDPSHQKLKNLFGGVPVPIPGNVPPNPPTPPTPPSPPSSLEQRVRELEVQRVVDKVTIAWCVKKIKSLGG